MLGTEIVEQARQNFYKTKDICREYGDIGKIWTVNIDMHLGSLIDKCQTPYDAISYLNDKAFYDHSCPEPFASYAIDWKVDLLKKYDVKLEDLPQDFQESDLIKKTHLKKVNGRLVSSDFLNRLLFYFRSVKSIVFPEKPIIFELGGGFGTLMRLMKIAHKKATCVFIDLPETLFFANIFMQANFPNAKFHYVHSSDSISKNISEYDFVFVPFMFKEALTGSEVSLFLNTNSMGEMPPFFIRDYFDFIQQKLDVKYFAFLNRFFNRLDDRYRDRFFSISPSFQFDEHWQFHDWEISPDIDSCPYIETTLTRNMFLVAERKRLSFQDVERKKKSAFEKLEPVKYEDWNTKIYWDDFKIKFGGDYPAIMSKGDRDLTPDLSANGSFYKIWDIYRYCKDLEIILMLIKYMSYLSGRDAKFEELYWLNNAYIFGILRRKAYEEGKKIGILCNVNELETLFSLDSSLFYRDNGFKIFDIEMSEYVVRDGSIERLGNVSVSELDLVYIFSCCEPAPRDLYKLIISERLADKLYHPVDDLFVDDVRAAQKFRAILDREMELNVWGVGSDFARIVNSFPFVVTLEQGQVLRLYDKSKCGNVFYGLLIRDPCEFKTSMGPVVITSRSEKTRSEIAALVKKESPESISYDLYEK